jgi:DNA modification methylase
MNKFKLIIGDSIIEIKKLDKKFNMIYLDPPFATGRDFFYTAHGDKGVKFSDSWKEGEYEKWLEELITNLKNVLDKNGTLFFHISSEQSHIPETILRKKFKNVEKIYWKKAHGKNTVKKKLGSVIDVIFYCFDNNPTFNLIYRPLNEFYLENSYNFKDSRGNYALGSIKHDKTRKGQMFEITVNEKTYFAEFGWKISKENLESLISENKIHFGKSMLYKKLYKEDVKGVPLSNLWDDISYITRSSKDQRYYPTQKPLELLKRLILMSTDKNGWILDPVAGSGTTAVAALQLERNVILIDINKETERIIRERIKNIENNLI